MKTIFTISAPLKLISRYLDILTVRRLQKLSRRGNTARGQRMAIYANDQIGHNINVYGVYDKDALDLLFKFLTPLKDIFSSGMALDIGANIGNHSVYFDKIFSRVCAFEPNPSTYQLLAFNASYSKSVQAYSYGLGDVSGVFDLYEDPENFGGSSVKNFDRTRQKPVPITIYRLDDLDIDFTNLGLIKIDVEGLEANVIRGGSKVIEKHSPIIILEQHAKEFCMPGKESETLSLLRSMGYRFCWKRFSKDLPWLSRQFNGVRELFTGKRSVIVTDSPVPRGTYFMLIAVPPKHLAALGLD